MPNNNINTNNSNIDSSSTPNTIVNNSNSTNNKDDSEDISGIGNSNNNLNKELIAKDNEIARLKNQLANEHKKFQSRIANIVADKNKLSTELHYYELMELDLKVAEFEKLKINYLKLEHRYNITKELLDDSRHQLAILEKVIYDLENIKFIDFIKNNDPTSFIRYKEEFRKETNDEL
ncbi:MAG: hypothetical protein ACRCVG_04445 [Methanobacteriaceae archaeon]